MANFEEVLEALREEARSESEKGRLFEKLMVAVLPQMPEYDFENVWLWKDWPERARLTNLDAKDIGIDLVGKEREDGGYCAIQCKFYDQSHALQKGDIDSFFTASGKEPFASRLIVTTTDKWSANAEGALEDQQIPAQRLRFRDLATWDIDWRIEHPEKTKVQHVKKKLRARQQEALKAVIDGFKEHDRGKLIMACGTGKTLTALHIAEKQVPKNGHVLFLVPSISLLSQALHEWAAQRSVDHRYLAVCSDTQVDRKKEEDMPVSDLAIPATTDRHRISRELKKKSDRLTIVFSTYQSLERIHGAQDNGAPAFDLVICDEAHRTTGVETATSEGKEVSLFSKIHDGQYIKAAKRLYMTATPRLYTEAVKEKAGEKNMGLFSMDDQKHYGPELYRLDFSTAVGEGLLSDYRVIVLAVNEESVSKEFQNVLSSNSDLNLGDAAKIVGCYKALRDQGKGKDGKFLKRAVSFSNTIKNSKTVRDEFQAVVDEMDNQENDGFTCKTAHVDGTDNALVRSKWLDWLRQDPGRNEHGQICHILSNAKCLTEGVDVPALDAIMFMNPRKSQVDVVQAVGRVMRKTDEKDEGYVILPVVIPSGKKPDEALNDNTTYQVVWQVLNALRSHDNRFNALINTLELNDHKPPQISIIGVGYGGEEGEEGEDTTREREERVERKIQLSLALSGEVINAIYAKIVDKCGDRRYWEVWAADIAHTYDTIMQLINTLRQKEEMEKTFAEFHQGIRANINDALSEDDAASMLAQHLITRPVFDALFDKYAFSEENPVSQSMRKVLEVMDAHGLANELKGQEGFYQSVRERASGIDNAEGRQKVIIELYEKFFKIAFKKTSESLGIAYTPIEIVDFILASADVALRQEFGRGLSDENIHIIDPFTGTGSFINRLVQNTDLISDKDLPRKFENELHANDILLLAYYIASVNIEEAYHNRMGGDYAPFPGIVLTDTFNLTERDSGMDDHFFPENNARLDRQRNAPIRVVVGNPPWSRMQASENDDNRNMEYPKLDESIRQSYGKQSASNNLNPLYDSYIRAIRWASNRIGEKGVIVFVTNGGFLEGASTDGLRKCLVEEFDAIWYLNFRGNIRKFNKIEGQNIFGQSSMTQAAITLLVRNPDQPRAKAEIFYHDIGDCLTRREKLDIAVEAKSIIGLEWDSITPNIEGDWINQRNPMFQTFLSLGNMKVKSGKSINPDTIFLNYSNGVVTNRDAWAYNFNRDSLLKNMQAMISFYNDQVMNFQKVKKQNKNVKIDNFINRSDAHISWSSSLKMDCERGKVGIFREDAPRPSLYRPFVRQYLYFDPQFCHRQAQMPSIFPSVDEKNKIIMVSGVGATEFSTLISNVVVDINFFTPTQCFPRYYWDKEGNKIDNIPNMAVLSFQNHYDDPEITGDDIFNYVYGVLHSPDYRKKFSADLKKELPRIPFAVNFSAFCNAGRNLADLHLNYETAEEYPLNLLLNGKPVMADLALKDDDYRVKKMRWSARDDRSRIIYNDRLCLSGIPEEALDYTVNGRPALDWVIARYQEKKDTASGITNNPNEYSDDPAYIIKHIRRVTTVSVESARIISELAKLPLE